MTQLFFENAVYFDYVTRARDKGVTVPILAGIMPIENADQIRRFCQRCGATIPTRLELALERCADDAAVRALGRRLGDGAVSRAAREGRPGIHFYTLNRSRATREILQALRRT